MKALTAQELRIGNWLHYSDFKDVKPELRNKDFQVIPDDIVYLSEHDTDWVEPIPLTEEWLLKAGFKKKKYDSEYWFEKIVNKKFRLLTNDIGPNGFSEKLEHVFVELRDFGNELVRVKYVHKLQNAVFEFTEKELQTK